MKSRLSTILSAISLLLCLVTCALFIRIPYRWPLGCPGWILLGLFAAGSAPLAVRKGEDKQRRLFTILAVISLVLFFISVSEWKDHGAAVVWNRFDHFSWPQVDVDDDEGHIRSTTHVRTLSFVVVKFVEVHGCYEWGRTIEIPGWLAVGLCAALPAIWFHRRRHLIAAWCVEQWRLQNPPLPGHCDRCGYDLRATPDRCPECGAVPEET